MSPPAQVQRSVVLMALAFFASSVSMRMCDPLLPVLSAQFGVDLATAAGTITGFALAYGWLQLAIGPMADRWGKFRVVRVAAALAALASLACALAPGIDSLVWARVAAGGVGGAIIPVGLAWIGDEVDYGQRQPVLARLMTGSLLGLILGQLISGVLADTLGWRWAFAVVAGLFGAVALAMWVGALPHQAPHGPGSERGAMVSGPQPPWSGWRSACSGYATLLRPPWSRLVLLAVVVEGLLMYGALSFVPSALHLRFGVPVWQAAGASALVGAGGLVYTLLASRLLRRLGERGLALGGGAIVTAGLLTIGLAPGLWTALVGCLALGLGFYAFHNTLQVHGTQLSTTRRGMGMALFALGLFMGQSIGVAVAAQVVEAIGFKPTFVGAALAFLVLAAGFAAALERRPG